MSTIDSIIAAVPAATRRHRGSDIAELSTQVRRAASSIDVSTATDDRPDRHPQR
ncbi:hypothetical protein [Plantactinospora soyae]|uniref:Uncharacterized protein n=1 Tax=Plantactinospora soyae TaxID=1544732 RepID=A0A927RBB6_9ACTN|nr:hypothetical protein [Plantactinospora soyae]MBE1491521.1 hypothetical protein [Plantactinospora soyae]